MNKPPWGKRRAHKKARCWAKPVHEDATVQMLRVCPHGVVYTIDERYDMFTRGKHQKLKREWRHVEDFFIESGTYDW